MSQELLPSGLVEEFCVHEDFLYRISSKCLLAAFSSNSKLNLKLIEVLESEAFNLLKFLCNSSKNPKKIFCVTSALNTSLVLHVNFFDVSFMITALVQHSQANQKLFHNCFVKMVAEDLLGSVHHSLQSEVTAIVEMINGKIIQVPDQSSSSLIQKSSKYLYVCVTL